MSYFYEFAKLSIPLEWRLDHQRRGGFNLSRWACPLGGDEHLRLLVAQEPAGRDGSLIWHASLSVGSALPGHASMFAHEPVRRPSKDEIGGGILKAEAVGERQFDDQGWGSKWGQSDLVWHLWEVQR